jgi:hypothetical protein
VSGHETREAREKILLVLGCAITSVWVFAVTVQVIFPTHVVPTEVHGVMLVLTPILFGSAAWQSHKNAGA